MTQMSLEAALDHHRAGRIAEAMTGYEQLLSLDPDNAAALQFLGVAKHQAGQSEQGVALIERAIRIEPGVPDFHTNLAEVFAAEGRFSEASTALVRALALRPDDVDLRIRLALYLRRAGRYAEAIDVYGAVLRTRPDLHSVAINLSALLIEQNRPAEALNVLGPVVSARSDSAEALGNVALALSRLKRNEDAVPYFERAIALNPNLPEMHTNFGASLLALAQTGRAVESQRRACALRPQWIMGKTNLAIALAHDGQADEALALHEEVLAAQPDHAVSLVNRGIIRLARGDYAGGWRDYEARLRIPELQTLPADALQRPQWTGGQDVAGKRVLGYAEQGIGDTIQFVRYVPQLVERGAKVVLRVHALLIRLLRHSFPNLEIIARGDPLPEFDLRVPIMSFPFAFGTTAETIPAGVPYLAPPPELKEQWAARLGARDALRVGIVWSGNPDQILNRHRSIPFEQMLRHFAAIPRVQIYSLQKGAAAGELAGSAFAKDVVDLAPELRDFTDTAAAISQLDVVISICTSVAHLAGALGAKTWTLLHEPADFRWMSGREDTPWYPTMRLIRQTRAGNWEDVLARAASELAGLQRA